VLLENRALPNILNSVGETPLSFACKYDMPDVVEVLLKGGADPSTVPQDGLKEGL
jgi:ankyrin repeat protein